MSARERGDLPIHLRGPQTLPPRGRFGGAAEDRRAEARPAWTGFRSEPGAASARPGPICRAIP